MGLIVSSAVDTGVWGSAFDVGSLSFVVSIVIVGLARNSRQSEKGDGQQLKSVVSSTHARGRRGVPSALRS